MGIKRLRLIHFVWVFAALAMVFAPALDAPELLGSHPISLTDTLGPRILAPASADAVTQEGRSAKMSAHSRALNEGTLVALLLLMGLGAARVAGVSTETFRSFTTRSLLPSRGPPLFAS